MLINLRFTPEDVAIVNGGICYMNFRCPVENYRSPVSCADIGVTAESWLEEMGCSGPAEVDFVRRADGTPCIGGYRLPLRVDMPHWPPIVLKRYDHGDASREREILRAVHGVVAPRLLYFGKRFYAEDLVDHAMMSNLLEVAADDGLEAAVSAGAYVHARLARLNVNYAHDHWLDEFHVRDDGLARVTDFGTSRFFHSANCSSLPLWFEEDLDALRHGFADYLDLRRPLGPFGPSHAHYRHIVSGLRALTPDDAVLLDLLSVFAYALKGIKRQAEFDGTAFHQNVQGTGWDIAFGMLPVFLRSFSEEWHDA